MTTGHSDTPLSVPLINPWLVAVTVALTTFMEVLDISIANVSLRHIAGDLAAGQDESTWILTSYLVANAIILPMSGWLSNLMGRRRFYLICVMLFTLSSLLCGLAPNLFALIFFRTLQGIGGGGLQPSSQAILSDTFPPHQRGMAFAVYGITTVMAPAIGPTVGGWITDTFSWRWIFLINVPIGIISFYLTRLWVYDPPHFNERRKTLLASRFKIDGLGFVLMALGFGCLQIVLDKGEQEDWFGSHFIVTLAVISALSLLVLPFWELRQKNPMMDFTLLKERNFLLSNILIFMLGFVLFSSTLLLPLFVQILMGYSATDAGLLLSPGGVAVLLFMPLIGYLINKTDVRRLIMIGLFLNIFSLLMFSRLNLQTDYATMALIRIVQGIGLGFLFVPINTAAFAEIPLVKSSNASAMINLSRNLGGSFGIALVQTWLSEGSQKHLTYLVGHLDPYRTLYQDSVKHIEQLITHFGLMSSNLNQTAQQLLFNEAYQQAELLAFLDNFRTLAWLFIAMIPAVFLLKKRDHSKR
ncbi:MAG: DHA2 family efflux MFS transporter permease subunit [Betaproteobacteria bacterium]|nr:DHA2 family efflux MFS transporter permease subunit [Betaproteobacteria bacterium]MDE2423676.1 DHA2 family efflux MFS transporter permease subunit [Betaproteobacteria bacterium]